MPVRRQIATIWVLLEACYKLPSERSYRISFMLFFDGSRILRCLSNCRKRLVATRAAIGCYIWSESTNSILVSNGLTAACEQSSENVFQVYLVRRGVPARAQSL